MKALQCNSAGCTSTSCHTAIYLYVATADGTFRLLHVTVARLFAEQLQKDLAALKEGWSSDVSLAAKWAPTPASKASAPSHCFSVLV